RNPDAVGGTADAAFEDVPDLEIAADLGGGWVLALVGEYRGRRDHRKLPEAPERGDEVFGQPIGKIIAAALRAERGERQYRDRGARRRDRGRRRRHAL